MGSSPAGRAILQVRTNMNDIRNKHVPPAIDELAFNCPHCGALAKQFWFSSHVERLKKDSTPLVLNLQKSKLLSLDHIEDVEERERWNKWAEKMAKGRPFIDSSRKLIDFDLRNVSVSRCFNCNDVTIWIYDRMVWPARGEAPIPNPDLPDEVRRDYDEASPNYSRRGVKGLVSVD